MNTTSTHDTKRGEDVRTRIAALSEMPDAWASTVRRFRERNSRYRRDGWPDPNIEYLLYQTLVGASPIELSRLDAYLQKATREANAHTSWSSPNQAYESAVRDFAGAILADRDFCVELEAFLRPIVQAGRLSSLSQLLIKLTAPGVPDVYQGTELWDLSLVDPDNRRPVDYQARRDLLTSIANAGPAEVLARMDEGAPKLWLLRRALEVRRRRRPELFGPGADYVPMEARGERADNVVAFIRGGGALTVAPRLYLGLGDPPVWGDTSLLLPAGKWRDALSGGLHLGGASRLSDLLREFPVALLVAENMSVARKTS